MQQELIKKKREIINTFLKNGILISSEMLDKINDQEHISRIFEALKINQINDMPVVGLGIDEAIEEAKTPEAPAANEEHPAENVRVIYSYKEEPKKREPQDFVDYFNSRYRAIEKILKQHQELKNTISINKITNKKEKESTSII